MSKTGLEIISEGDNQSRGGHMKDCRQCVSWFLGCLNGRKEWADKAVMPNLRHVGQSGKVYPDGWWRLPESEHPPKSDLPLRTLCDAFEWDPNPKRQGRAVCG